MPSALSIASSHPADCFHCGLPVPRGLTLTAQVLGEARPMCCVGCCAVAEMFEAQGLSDWYLRRETPTGFQAVLLPEVEERVAYLETPAFAEDFVESTASGVSTASLLVEGLVCAACVWVIERHMGLLDGIQDVRISLASRRIHVQWDSDRLDLRDVILRLAEIGFAARPDRPGDGAELERSENRSALIRLGVSGLGAMNVMTYSVALYAGAFDGMSAGTIGLMRWMGLIVATPVVLVSARPFFRAAWREMRLLAPGMDIPVSLAIAGAYLVSVYATWTGEGEVYFDSVCMFTFFLGVGRYLEMRIRHRSSMLTRNMIDATPLIARREGEDGERVVPAHALVVGDRFRVRPGESLPADGVVLEGRSAVEEALLTGEPWPRSVESGTAVIAGSINVESPILVEATRVGDATTMASIVALIERAESDRPPVAQMADRVAGFFVTGVLGVALANWVVWHFLEPERAIWTTLAVLVATCPCALSLATPTAIAAATHALAKAGLVMTSGRVLFGLSSADRFIFDKTGTLTRGHPTLARVIPIRGHGEAEMLAIAQRLERDSEHPFARAIVRDAAFGVAGVEGAVGDVGDVGVADVVGIVAIVAVVPRGSSGSPEPVQPVESIRSIPGFGVEGTLDDEHYRIGRPEWASAGAGDFSDAAVPDHAAFTWVLLADEEGALAWFGLEDPVRLDASTAIEGLRERNLALEMLSGDPSPFATRVADRLGLEIAKEAATPQEKVDRVRALQAKGERVVVVGDGVNDGPFLQAGDVSIAMGSGCDLSRMGADGVLMRDELSLLPRAVVWSARVRRILFQNFGWAITYNLLALPLAVSGHLPPWLAALGMSTSSLVVVLNALRLNRLPEAP
jgi:Cu2+-exporting ATPase